MLRTRDREHRSTALTSAEVPGVLGACQPQRAASTLPEDYSPGCLTQAGLAVVTRDFIQPWHPPRLCWRRPLRPGPSPGSGDPLHFLFSNFTYLFFPRLGPSSGKGWVEETICTKKMLGCIIFPIFIMAIWIIFWITMLVSTTGISRFRCVHACVFAHVNLFMFRFCMYSHICRYYAFKMIWDWPLPADINIYMNFFVVVEQNWDFERC